MTSASPSPAATNTTPTTGNRKPSVAAIVPVGPGHETLASECQASIRHAWASAPGCFGRLATIFIDDSQGKLGRSAARNKGLDLADTDWVLLIDADDLLLPQAFASLPPLNPPAAYWGMLCTEDGITGQNILPCTWRTLMENGARHTLSMGCFIQTSAARETRFLETLDAGEDFEFYLALCANHPFRKLGIPLVTIRRRVSPATGPRGYATLDWNLACDPIVSWWRSRGRVPATYQERLAAFTP